MKFNQSMLPVGLLSIVLLSACNSSDGDGGNGTNPSDDNLRIVEELETNNTYSNALNLGLIEYKKDVLVEGSLNSNSDVDWYRFTLPGPIAVNFSVPHEDNSNIDIYIWRPSDNGQATCNSQENPEICGFTMAHASAGDEVYVKLYGTNGGVYNFEIALR